MPTNKALPVLYHVLIAVCIALASSKVWAGEAKISKSGWTVSADPDLQALTISHDQLGVILRDVRLQTSSPDRKRLPTSWTIHQVADTQLSIKIDNPPSTWVFDVSSDDLRISTTSTTAVVIGNAPSGLQRIAARLVDPQGTPVDWVGTGEVAVTYGGAYTRRPSFLPRRNPECAYFAMGQSAGPGLHSLFDRPSDIAIDFPDDTSMTRDAQDANLLDISIPVPGNTSIRLMPDYFTQTLGVPFYVPFDDENSPTAPMVWSSWTSYYERVTEADIIKNTDWIAARLKPYGFEFVQLDDGYDRGPKGEHYWIDHWDHDKFPHGAKWLAAYIHAKGLRPGIWLVPNSQQRFVNQHPDWYLYYKNGAKVMDYNTPALDSTNPAVLDLLSNEFSTLRGWGYEYFKIDGEHAIAKYVPNVDTVRLFDVKVDPVIAYRKRLAVIRQAIGPKSVVEGDIAGTPLNGVGYIDSFFNGHDLYDNWQGMYSLFSSIGANVFFNHIVAYTMPGEGMAVEPKISFEQGEKQRNASVVETERSREFPLTGFGTTLAESRTVVSLVALSGVAYSLASVMPELPEERVHLLEKTLPTMPIFPVDLFSRGNTMEWDKFKTITPDDYIHNYPEIVDLKINAPAGNYDVVAMTNWRTWGDKRQIKFHEKLGLEATAPYIAFDFWNQKILGVFRHGMEVEILPHDTRVIALHPLLGHPQLVGISRHITGAYSAMRQTWNQSTRTLAGSAQGVPGDPYTLWIYVPDGVMVSQANASVGERTVSVKHAQAGNAVSVTFTGENDPVDWRLSFAPPPTLGQSMSR